MGWVIAASSPAPAGTAMLTTTATDQIRLFASASLSLPTMRVSEPQAAASNQQNAVPTPNATTRISADDRNPAA